MQAEFYDVKAKAKVRADVSKKVAYKKVTTKGTQFRYAFKAVGPETGCSLTKFVSKDLYDSANVPAEVK